MESISPFYSLTQGVNYSPPWQDLSIIGIAGCSGSGKTSVAMEIVKSLNLPWVVILSLVCFKHAFLLLEYYIQKCGTSFLTFHRRIPSTSR